MLAMLTFVCSVGNMPLAAVLWSGGISFAGVVSFIFADLVILPIVAIYRKYYGSMFTAGSSRCCWSRWLPRRCSCRRCSAPSVLIPTGARPSSSDIFGSVTLDYKLWLNVAGLVLFCSLFGLTLQRGAVDPVCGMMVDRHDHKEDQTRWTHLLLLLRRLPQQLQIRW